MPKEVKKTAAAPSSSGGRVLNIDFTGVESGGGKIHVPEGDYGIELIKLVVKKGEDSGKPYLDCGFKIVQGNKGVGRSPVKHNFSLQKQSLWNLRNFLEAAGKKVPSSAVKLDLDKLVGLQTGATLTDDEYEGRKYSVIAGFFPLADLDLAGGSSSSSSNEEEGEESEEQEESDLSSEETEEAEELFE